MNKHLNNWLDEVEGKPVNTTNNAITTELKRQGYLSESELELLKECDGVHDSVEDIIKCKSCEVLLK